MRLALYAASYVDKNTAVLSLCPGRTKTTLASLSCCCALDAVIRNDSRLQRCVPAAQLGCSSNVSAPVPADCPRDARELSVIIAAIRDSSAGTRLFGYTAIFVFFLSVSPDFTLHSQYDSGSIHYRLDRFSKLANNRSCLLRSKYFACIFNGFCVPGTISTQP